MKDRLRDLMLSTITGEMIEELPRQAEARWGAHQRAQKRLLESAAAHRVFAARTAAATPPTRDGWRACRRGRQFLASVQQSMEHRRVPPNARCSPAEMLRILPRLTRASGRGFESDRVHQHSGIDESSHDHMSVPTHRQCRRGHDPRSFVSFHHRDERIQTVQGHRRLRVEARQRKVLINQLSQGSRRQPRNQPLSLQRRPCHRTAAWSGAVLGMHGDQGEPEESRPNNTGRTLEEPEAISRTPALILSTIVACRHRTAGCACRAAGSEILRSPWKNVRGVEKPRADRQRIAGLLAVCHP